MYRITIFKIENNFHKIYFEIILSFIAIENYQHINVKSRILEEIFVTFIKGYFKEI